MKWNVAILYRRYDPDHSKSYSERLLRTMQWMHHEHGPYCHVEIVFKLPCEGGDECPSKPRGPVPLHDHRVSYSTSWTEGKTYRSMDREYRQTRALWDIQRLQIDDLDRIEAMLDFLDSQFEAKFGLLNMLTNFSMGMIVRRQPIAFQRLKPRLDTERQFVAQELLKRRKQWFCSELVCSTLIFGGVITHDGTSPSITSPQILRELPKRFVVDPHPIALSVTDFTSACATNNHPYHSS